jgi:hypothetical protein
MMRLLPLISLIACSSDLPVPAYRYGVLLADLQFEVTDPDMGIHPNVSILADPENPFAEGGISLEGKFSAYSDSPTAGFYGMGTALANQPTGEHQYYTAASLEGIYDERDISDPGLVRDMAIRAYQSVLDNFPGSVTFDESGRFSFPLGPLAIDGIEGLGGTVQNGWVKVATADGSFAAVQNQ